MTFDQFNFDEKIMEGIRSLGFEKPTPIQEKTIPMILEGKDLIACAQTGTGKTAAYLLPVLQRIIKNSQHFIDTLIIVPTRELAVQIDQQLEGLAYFTGVSSIAIYGGGDGSDFERQKKALSKGADIVIATPGKLISHLSFSYAKMGKINHLILDEADRMLDMGFFDDIMKIIKNLPEKRQNLLFSATMPPQIRTLASKILTDPETVNIAVSKPAEGILQAAYMAYNNQKSALVKDLLKGKKIQSVIIFSATKLNVKEIDKELQKMGLSSRAIHSDLDQPTREEVLRDFKHRKFQILVATDVVSRGIDIDGINLVINYDVPRDAEDYVHRIGRTARADTTGVALTFINEKEQEQFQKIEKLIEREIFKIQPPPEIGKGPDYQPEKKAFKPKNKQKRRN